jgi:hypothetical protein
MRPARLALAVASALLVAGCQSPDVGQRCQLPFHAGATNDGPTPETAAGDYLEVGNTACDNLICIVSPAVDGGRYNSCAEGNCGYCSKPCVSDQDCSTSQTGLVCRQMVLDPAFIQKLQQTDPALLETYLSDIRFSSYCAVSR